MASTARAVTTGRSNKRPTPAAAARPVSTGRTAAAPARETRAVRAPEPIVEEQEEILDEATQQETEQLLEDALQNTATEGSGDDLLNLSTSELDSPARKADAHRGRITGVIEHHSEQKGTPAIRILLHSDDADFDGRQDIYVPRPFEDNIRVDPRELSKIKDEEAGTSNEQMQYAMSIHNKRNDAVIDKLRAIAKGEGRSLDGYAEPMETFTDFIAALNTLFTDMPVIFFRRPRKDNPNFLEVHDYLAMSALDDPKQQGKFKGRVCAWVGE